MPVLTFQDLGLDKLEIGFQGVTGRTFFVLDRNPVVEVYGTPSNPDIARGRARALLGVHGLVEALREIAEHVSGPGPFGDEAANCVEIIARAALAKTLATPGDA